MARDLPAKGSSRRIEPVSEIERDPTLRSFLDHLNRIVAEKNEMALLAEMEPVFRVEFSRGKGPTAFRRYWKPESADTRIWKVLERLFAMGGTFYSPGLFAIPYIYTRFPIDLDPFEYVVAEKDNVPVRAGASSQDQVIGTISCELVRVTPRLKPPVHLDAMQWLRIITPSGATGFVSTSDVYSPAAHRAFFEKRRGRWRWISLVCAD